jgi:hypothetical protein
VAYAPALFLLESPGPRADNKHELPFQFTQVLQHYFPRS